MISPDFTLTSNNSFFYQVHNRVSWLGRKICCIPETWEEEQYVDFSETLCKVSLIVSGLGVVMCGSSINSKNPDYSEEFKKIGIGLVLTGVVLFTATLCSCLIRNRSERPGESSSP